MLVILEICEYITEVVFLGPLGAMQEAVVEQGLKSHAVTMFEVGKLNDESLDSFLAELGKVNSSVCLFMVAPQ